VKATADGCGLHGRRSRVVLTPRRWCQRRDDASHRTEDGGQKARRTRESTKETVEPSRRECRMLAEPVVTAACYLSAGGPWVRPSPGIPCALFDFRGPNDLHNSGADASRDRVDARRSGRSHGGGLVRAWSKGGDGKLVAFACDPQREGRERPTLQTPRSSVATGAGGPPAAAIGPVSRPPTPQAAEWSQSRRIGSDRDLSLARFAHLPANSAGPTC
jgi:hypothetical protein